ncbi:hypothetical protein MMC25_005790 [Agyrium rufum]|nr:hypothetical protein [Agyrium rufum]
MPNPTSNTSITSSSPLVKRALAISEASSRPQTPDFTPAETPPQGGKDDGDLADIDKMADLNTTQLDASSSGKDEAQPVAADIVKAEQSAPKEITEPTKKASNITVPVPKTPSRCKKHKHAKRQSRSKKIVVESSSSESSDSDSSSDSESEDSESSSEEERRKKRSKRRAAKKRAAKKKAKSRKKYSSSEDSSSSSSSDSSDSSSEDEKPRKSRKSKSSVPDPDPAVAAATTTTAVDSENEEDDPVKLAEAHLEALKARKERRKTAKGTTEAPPVVEEVKTIKRSKSSERQEKQGKKGRPAYFRCDQIWDNEAYNWKLCETNAEQTEDQYGQYIFHIRRNMDFQGRYDSTVVDIKSKALRDALKVIMKACKAVSLEEETPECDPNMLFLYLDEMKAYSKKLRSQERKTKKRKNKKRIALQRAHLKLLTKYLDKDYAKVKEALYPLLEAKMITFEYIWALYKSEDIAYSNTYGDNNEPRAFVIEVAQKEQSLIKGQWYQIEGNYLEYDGKAFGRGSIMVEQEAFKGAKAITSLACYPLKYHADPKGLRERLIARGKKFIALKGMNYRYHKGMAYVKRKRQIIKVNIDGRIMIDPAGLRKINPNYPISNVQPDDPDLLDPEDMGQEEQTEEVDEGGCGCCADGEDEGGNMAPGNESRRMRDDDDQPKMRMKLVQDKCGRHMIVEVEVDEDGREIKKEKLMESSEDSFTDNDFLIASPVVLGFSFSEKLWLEFSVSGIKDIEWNDAAFGSLQLPEGQKSIVKALVSSHSRQSSRNIDDVVQGKGRGLVAVLHGPPGTGKTLTAEGISEFLRCPLYMVSAGELGTSPKELEMELTKILEIAHSWGAVLLLDEADVFLEKRTVQDIHRNALVSIFLRLLEYFQGILFLTTNRVETFDDAFQSRIHIALRYGALTVPAKKSVWKMFLGKVREIEGADMADFKESDYDRLAKRNLNGRQIKNAVRTAQSLAVDEGKPLCMPHVLRVLGVADDFEKDLKGGTGYEDAMRSYN